MDGINVQASLSSLDRVSKYVLLVGERGNLSPNAAYRLRLAADEIVSNIIMHGYKEPSGEIVISGGVDREKVWVRIIDNAPRFDPRKATEIALSSSRPDLSKVGGLGLFLALRAVDDYRYEFVNGANQNFLSIRRNIERQEW